MSYNYTLNKITLTDAGRALLQRAIGGEELSFSTIALGDSIPPNNFSYDGLASERLRVPVRKVTSYSNKTIINTFITNATVETSFDVCEVGIFAVDPVTSEEILYAYGYFNPKTDTIPAASISLMEEVYEIEVYTSNVSNITATIDSSLVFVLQSDFELLKTRVRNAEDSIDDIEENYSLITETGSKIHTSYNSSNNKVTITLKNANDTSISTSEFTVPISDTFKNCSYANGNLTFTYKNNTTKQVSIDGLISNLVPKNRTLAGIDLNDNITKNELLEALGLNTNGVLCPSGMIVMWSGSIANIPNGWFLCDGQNGTPDLRNRFIVGAGDEYSVRSVGGSNTVTLSKLQMPIHSHNIDMTGTATFKTGGYGNYGTTKKILDGIKDAYNKYWYTEEIEIEGTCTCADEGGGQAHENRPPYYALAFIMKA